MQFNSRVVMSPRRYQAERYVLVDDKPRILASVKQFWGERVTTIFHKQGHYAHDQKTLAEFPAADIELAKIADLMTCDLSQSPGSRGVKLPNQASR